MGQAKAAASVSGAPLLRSLPGLDEETNAQSAGRSLNAILMNPLVDRKWEDAISTHPDATIFHSTAWARLSHGADCRRRRGGEDADLELQVLRGLGDELARAGIPEVRRVGPFDANPPIRRFASLEWALAGAHRPPVLVGRWVSGHGDTARRR